MEPLPNVTDINRYQVQKSQSKKIWVVLIIGGSLGLVGGLTYYWFGYLPSHIWTDNAYVESDILPVNSRIMGMVKEVYVTEAQAVKKGQLLAKLDETDFALELSFKETKLKKAEADFARATRLRKYQALSTSDFELARANMLAAQADRDGTNLKILYTNVLATQDGIVAKRNIQEGQFVQPGQSLMVIVGTSPIWVKANYKETQINRMHEGQSVEIHIDSFPDDTWGGKIEKIFPASGSRLSLLPPENATGNFTKVVQRIPVKISLEQKQGKILRTGLSVETIVLVQ